MALYIKNNPIFPEFKYLSIISFEGKNRYKTIMNWMFFKILPPRWHFTMDSATIRYKMHLLTKYDADYCDLIWNTDDTTDYE